MPMSVLLQWRVVRVRTSVSRLRAVPKWQGIDQRRSHSYTGIMDSMPSPKRVATVFLNGRYDRRYPSFYAQSCGEDAWVVCADGALAAFDWLRGACEGVRAPDLVVGDFDSLAPEVRDVWEGVGVVFEAKRDQDDTDGQVALRRAIESGCGTIRIHGGFPHADAYDHDHFLGNLWLLDEGHAGGCDTTFSEPFEEVHWCTSALRVSRRGHGLNRVSVVACHGDAVVAEGRGLRWELDGFVVSARRPNALRNEIRTDASQATIRLSPGSPPVLVIHNWYAIDATDN